MLLFITSNYRYYKRTLIKESLIENSLIDRALFNNNSKKNKRILDYLACFGDT